ncbi:MAG: GNAT family N-acetyltransferase [Minisyncoccota bacterium]
MDVLVWETFDLLAQPVPSYDNPFQVRTATRDDAGTVRAIAESTFRDYAGHYRNDPRLPCDLADAVYASWAERSCTVEGVADVVLLFEEKSTPVAFVTVRRTAPDATEIPLGAVLPAWRGQGLFRYMLLECLEWSLRAGARQVRATTQLANRRTQRTLRRIGFTPAGSALTFHVWFSWHDRTRGNG